MTRQVTNVLLSAALLAGGGTTLALAQGAGLLPQAEPQLTEEVYYDGEGDAYRLGLDGTVYEVEEGGRLDADADLKIENGQVLELVNGTWQLKDAQKQQDSQSASKPSTEDPAQSPSSDAGQEELGHWELEGDLKIVNGSVYEYEHGSWVPSDDHKLVDGVLYELEDGVWVIDDETKVEGEAVWEYEDHDSDDEVEDRDDWDEDSDEDDWDDDDWDDQPYADAPASQNEWSQDVTYYEDDDDWDDDEDDDWDDDKDDEDDDDDSDDDEDEDDD